MKRIASIVLFTLALRIGTDAADSVTTQDQQLLSVIKQIQAQQVTLAENQAKIEAKITVVAEAVRVARIYSSRGGR